MSPGQESFRNHTGAIVSISEIRERAQKPQWRTDGNWLARLWARPAAVYGTWVALRLQLSANFITSLAAVAWLFEAICIGSGRVIWFEIGVLFGFIGFWLDHVDGQVARMTNSESVSGIFLDFWMHTAHGLVRAFALGFGLYKTTGNDLFLLYGMATAFGWAMLSHSNDARYKAFLAQLNKADKPFAAQKPKLQSRPDITCNRPSWPLRRLLTWPLVKAQEPHIVLLLETAVGIGFLINQATGLILWRYFLLFWAFTSPMLAVARVSRLVISRQIDREFDSWFRPL